MDGFEAADALRSRQPSLKVLYMSGEEEADRHAGRATEGTESFLLKPFTPRAFTDAVRALMSPVNVRAVS
jgi:CheY-like chemotaxis protein